MYASKTYAVNFTAVASGNGLWGMKKGTVVNFDSITLHISEDDGELYGTLNATHDADASKFGLCYTDDGINAALNTFIQKHDELSKLVRYVDGSEQGMQDDDLYSCDAEICSNVDREAIIAFGFEVDDEE